MKNQHPFTRITDKEFVAVKALCSFGQYLDTVVKRSYDAKGEHTRGEEVSTSFGPAVSTREGYKTFVKEWKRRYKFVSAAIRLAKMQRSYSQSWLSRNATATGYHITGASYETLQCAARCLLEIRHEAAKVAGAAWTPRPQAQTA